MVDRTYLVEAAVRLRGSAPAAWEDFLQALKHYQAQLIGDMIKCDVTALVKAQAMVQMTSELLQTLSEAPKIKERLQETKNGGRPNPVHS